MKLTGYRIAEFMFDNSRSLLLMSTEQSLSLESRLPDSTVHSKPLSEALGSSKGGEDDILRSNKHAHEEASKHDA